MSKNNLIKKSDKKYIRLQKARIRAQFLDVKKQQEMINELYQRFIPKAKVETTEVKAEKKELVVKKEVKKEKPKKVASKSKK